MQFNLELHDQPLKIAQMKQSLLLLVLILILSCNSKEKKVHGERLSTVTICGVSDDASALESLNILNPSYFNTSNHKNEVVTAFQDSVSILLKEVRTPNILWISAFGDKGFYSTRVFVEKDEDIHFQIRKGRFHFSGKQAAQHNFFAQLDSTDAAWTQLKFKNYTGDIERYKEQCDSLYAQRIQFLDEYKVKNANVSKEFVATVENELKFEYLRNLISPRFEISGNYTINTSQDLADLLANSERKEGLLFDLNDYVNKVTLKEFNNPNLVHSDSYKMSLVPFIRQYFVQSKATPYSQEAFLEEVSFIQQNFHTDIAELAIGKLVVDYYKNGMGKDQNSRFYFTKFLRSFQETLSDSTNINSMNDIYNELEAMNAHVPSFLRQPLLNAKRDTVKIPPFLQTKNIKVLNFWASWCEPCIREFKDSREIRDRLATEYNVEFVYLSLDANAEKWIQSSKQFDKLLNPQNYLIFNPRKSTLIRTLRVKASHGISIPRYVILDSDNRVIHNNAPRPSSDEFEMTLKLIK